MKALPRGFSLNPYCFPPRPAGEHQWSVFAVGDIMTYTPIQRTASVHAADPGETCGGYDWVLSPVRELIARADLAIGNLEFPVSPRAPVSGRTPFNGDPLYLDALRKIGFHVLFTANNHMLDQGIRGSEDTVEALQSRGIMTLGTSRVGQVKEELLTVELGEERKIKLGLLNYTKGLTDMSRLVNLNYILRGRNINYALFKKNERFAKELFRNIARLFFPSALIVDAAVFIERVAERIREARAHGVNYVVVFLHWGETGKLLPSADQRDLALELCRAGADAIIGAGPHMIQPIELVDAEGNTVSGPHEAGRPECFVAYSLGNFISRPSAGPGAYGIVLEMTIAEDGTGSTSRTYVHTSSNRRLTLETVLS